MRSGSFRGVASIFQGPIPWPGAPLGLPRGLGSLGDLASMHQGTCWSHLDTTSISGPPGPRLVVDLHPAPPPQPTAPHTLAQGQQGPPQEPPGLFEPLILHSGDEGDHRAPQRWPKEQQGLCVHVCVCVCVFFAWFIPL